MPVARLLRKSVSSFLGSRCIWQYVKQCIDRKDTRFFPLKKAGRLAQTTEDEDQAAVVATAAAPTPD